MRRGRWSLWGALALLSGGCGGPEPPADAASPSALPSALIGSCDILRGDADCRAPGTSALQCRTRRGAQRGVCVDDFINPCARLGRGEATGCMFDQHCADWSFGWSTCTEYGAHGIRGCGVCRAAAPEGS